MRTRTQWLLIALGIVLVLGISPFLLPMAISASEDAASENPLRELVSRQSNLERFYLGWQRGYLAQGGDREIAIAVAWTEALSTERSRALGRVELDLIDGTIRAEVRGLNGRPADLWLVDNQDGPGRTVRPETGDRMVHVGPLRPDGTVSADLTPASFRDFELDLAVVSARGRTPAESRLLVGSRPFFERLYTRTRVAREKAREREARLFGPALLRAEGGSSQVLVDQGLVGQVVADGADLFFRETFGGNGRTCGTCHRAENNLGLDLEFISTLRDKDELFIAERPASEGGVPGLERPRLLRGHAQVLMNSDGFEDPTGKFVMRAVQHTLSLATSINSPDNRLPIQRTGWSGDAASGNGALRLLPAAAVKQHNTRTLGRVEGTDFVLPTDAQLDAIEAFTLASGRLNELRLADVELTNAAAQAGKVSFGFCSGCHFNAGAALPAGQNINANTGVERAPDPSQETEPHPHDGGFGAGTSASLDCDGDGVRDCFGDGSFNVPPLIEAADTEPFFHNNSAATIEDAVRFYTTDVSFRFPLTEEEVQDVGAFLRVLNAAFNSAISIQRNSAALTLEKAGRGEGRRDTVNMLLALSNSEAADAIEVLGERKLHLRTIKLLKNAIVKNGRAIEAGPSNLRQALIRGALKDLKAAKAQFGTGLDFTLGEGNLLF
ncbi:MAG: hypothetical protein ACLGI9_18090 [Thermoanaerobaculia bacterium]